MSLGALFLVPPIDILAILDVGHGTAGFEINKAAFYELGVHIAHKICTPSS